MGIIAVMACLQYRCAQAVIAVTPQLVEWISRDTGQNTVAVVSNGANVEIFAPGRRRLGNVPDNYAVFFGALHPWQGVQTILDATKEPEWPESVQLVVVGDGQLADSVRVAAAQAPQRVHYLGRLPYHDVPAVVSNSLVSLVGFGAEQRTASGVSPLKLYESMACGRVADLHGVEVTYTPSRGRFYCIPLDGRGVSDSARSFSRC